MDDADQKPFCCPVCNKKCRSRRGVLDHAEARHKKAHHIRHVADWWAETATPEEKTDDRPD